MAQTVTAAVRNDEQNVVVDDDYDGASSSRGSGWIANHEVVMMAIVQWPESCRWQARVAVVLGLKSTKMWEKSQENKRAMLRLTRMTLILTCGMIWTSDNLRA